MIKVTKFENNGERVLMKDNGVKVEYVDGVIKIYDGKKVAKTLKSPKTMKKYIEVIESYKAKKGFNTKKEEEKVEQQEMQFDQKEEKNEQVKSSVANYIQEKKNKEIIKVVDAKNDTKEQKKKETNIEKVINENDEKWKNFYANINDLPLTTKTIVIDATCKAHKEVVNGITSRFTRFTIFLTTDNKDLNDRLIKCLVENMEKNLLDGFGYGFTFDRETLRSYPRGKDICHEMTLTIPLTSGMSEIRKNVCTCYYASKKNVQAFYKELKAWKLRQEQGNKKKQSA